MCFKPLALLTLRSTQMLLLLALLPLCLATAASSAIASSGSASSSLGALVAASADPYSPALAKLLVYYTAASYCSNRTLLASWTCPKCSPPGSNAPALSHVQVLWNATSQVQGYVAYEAAANLTVVAFRGSVGTLNWIEDFDFSLVPHPACAACRVSKGFSVDTYSTIVADVRAGLAAVRAAVGPSPVLLTGHSLGAALAELLAYDLATAAAAAGPPAALAAVITFGKPRVGNAAWAQAWAAALRSATPLAYRVTHYEDPVPHLPLELMGFSHPPTEVCVAGGEALRKGCATPLWLLTLPLGTPARPKHSPHGRSFYNSESATAYVQCSSSDGEDPTCSNSILCVAACGGASQL